MKIVHIESGLGNQMLSFCEYLALKKLNPSEDIYIENIIYDIPECNDIICQWNGYELERVFNIKVPNVSEVFSSDEWNQIMLYIRSSQFWKKNWNYPVYFTTAFQQAGLEIINFRGDFEEPLFRKQFSEKHTFKRLVKDSAFGDKMRRLYYAIIQKEKIKSVNMQDKIFITGGPDIFTGQRLAFKYVSNGIEEIDSEIRRVFKFPQITDIYNKRMFEIINNANSVAIHARRGDMLGYNGGCYKYGYFKRAVKYIKRHVENPIFVFFCDPGSVNWCKENEKVFSLDFEQDKVYFVDWNKGTDSYRDMQLMSYCKHAIITNSSFGWWGAYLINNTDKITISPNITINTTYHC